MGLLDHLVETARMLESGAWRPSRACRFVVRHPKPREILAAEFGNRVVHHLVVPWFERRFEDGYLRGGMAQRSLRWIFTPPGSHAAADVSTASPAISPVFE